MVLVIFNIPQALLVVLVVYGRSVGKKEDMSDYY